MIGNLPVKVGDRVWTDGRIVYGHVPVRQTVTDFSRVSGYLFYGFGAGLLRKNGTPYGWSEWKYPDIMWFNLPSEIKPINGKGALLRIGCIQQKTRFIAHINRCRNPRNIMRAT